MEKNIVLIGFMGAGKSTVGRSLAEKIKEPFMDIDTEIEKKEGRSIFEVFETDSEEGFREIESREIEKTLNLSGYVIACGGGAVLKPENVAALKSNGIFVYLKADANVIEERVGEGGRRPLLKSTNPRQAIDELLREREAKYSQVADVIIDTSDLEAEQVVDKVMDAIDAYR